jgi:hypothetical protein
MSVSLRRVKVIVDSALTQAANDYTRDRGRFLPFALHRIHHALQDCNHYLLACDKWQHGSGLHESAIDVDAFRRGLMIHERVELPNSKLDIPISAP